MLSAEASLGQRPQEADGPEGCPHLHRLSWKRPVWRRLPCISCRCRCRCQVQAASLPSALGHYQCSSPKALPAFRAAAFASTSRLPHGNKTPRSPRSNDSHFQIHVTMSLCASPGGPGRTCHNVWRQHVMREAERRQMEPGTDAGLQAQGGAWIAWVVLWDSEPLGAPGCGAGSVGESWRLLQPTPQLWTCLGPWYVRPKCRSRELHSSLKLEILLSSRFGVLAVEKSKWCKVWLICDENEGPREKVLPYIILKKGDDGFRKPKNTTREQKNLILNGNTF